MGGIYGRKKGGRSKNKFLNRDHKTKHYKRDTDQIYDDVQPENIQKFEKLEINEELPGLGQFYCIQCARYVNNQVALDNHNKTKLHKKAKKRVLEKPYTIEDAEEFGKY